MSNDESKKIVELELENEELKRLLNSKRYRIINSAVNFFYSIARKKPVTSSNTIQKRAYNINNTRHKVDFGRIDIINVNFYDWDGNTLYKGGAERYVFDLVRLIKKLGYRPRIIQGANRSFNKVYRGVEIVGLKSPTKDMELLSRLFNDFCKDAELIIASPLELACNITCGAPVVGINHGINFDHISNSWGKTAGQPFSIHKDALLNVHSCVCVDTNFINWVRTRDYKLSMKLSFIPNYYDTCAFKEVSRTAHKKIRFVYPRRIYSARGYDITIDAFESILAEMPDKVELYFIGQYDSDEVANRVESFMQKYPKNVFHEEFAMEEMPKAYQKADVVLIPTRYSEGTSLSCIEGMASGAAIIATTVGGLPNLIIDGFNGLLINATSQDLESAARLLINKRSLIDKLSANGKNVASAAFPKKVWDENWSSLLKKILE